ncbi:hypothetical protein BTZ20_4368 [Rhodococcus sp. MTM3W5.2]|nr:hypothetical protein BTZ20_4368 [Rhodococcus sp. MTM3W5.2]
MASGAVCLKVRVRQGHRTEPCEELAGDALQLVSERGGFFRGQLDDEPTSTLERNPHDDSSPFLGGFEGTVTGPGLHGRHYLLPPDLR